MISQSFHIEIVNPMSNPNSYQATKILEIILKSISGFFADKWEMKMFSWNEEKNKAEVPESNFNFYAVGMSYCV